MTTVEILTTNFSGQTAQITFTPCSGGTIDLGAQVLPYNYVSDNYEGSYSLYFPDFTKTCTFDIPCSTNVPTPTPTYSQTITPTYSQTVTPTYSQTITPTIEATATPTPTYSQTATPTYSQTVTPTYSQTITPTSTVEVECNCYEFFIDEREFGEYGGPILQYLDCSSSPQSFGFSGIGGFSGYCISSITDWYRYTGSAEGDIAVIEFSTYTNTGNPCTVDGDCIVTGEPTPTPTPTPTLTVTPTYSQTVTPTYSQTVTPTYSQTVTPTHSQTVTPTYSQTITPTQTITLTETLIFEPTPTPTPISETPCDCYTVECTNPEGCELLPYENCNGEIISGFAIAGSTTASICGNIIN
jgi:hypothetical protein